MQNATKITTQLIYLMITLMEEQEKIWAHYSILIGRFTWFISISIREDIKGYRLPQSKLLKLLKQIYAVNDISLP